MHDTTIRVRPRRFGALGSLAVVLAVLGAARAAEAAPSVYGESAMVKVLPSATARADTGVGLTAARNEFVSFQVVVNGADTGANNVSASFSGLSGPGNISGPDITLYREALLNISKPTFPGGKTGGWPDPLVPATDEIAGETRNAFPFSVPANQARAIWVDVHVPQNASPGVYTGTVDVTGDNGLSAKVPVNLTVVGITLPSTATLTSAFRITQGQVCAAHGTCNGTPAVQNTLLARYAQMALEHRITLTNIFPPDSDGTFTLFNQFYGPFLQGTSPARLQGAQVTTVMYQGQNTPTAYQAFVNNAQAQGALSKAFDYSGDEPPYGVTWPKLQAHLSMVRSAAPSLPTLVTTTASNASANGALADIDILSPVINFLHGNTSPYVGDQRQSFNAFLSSGSTKRLWTYQSCMSQGCAYGTTAAGNSENGGWPSYMVDTSAGRNRAMEWVSFSEQVSGELYYDTANMLTSAWTNQYAFNGNGDGTLFYPGTPSAIGGTTDVPVASIRLKMIRQGMQDYEWLKLVSQGDPQFASTAAQALAPNPYQVTNDGAAYDRARLQLISRALQLQGQASSSSAQGAPPSSPASGSTLVSAIQAGKDPVTASADAQSGTSAPATASGGESTSKTGGGCSAAGGVSWRWPLLALAGATLLLRRRRLQPARVRKDAKQDL
jgi:hypothetical protein